MTTAILWENKTWAIHRRECCGACKNKPYMLLEKKTTGQCDYPIQYHTGFVVYDFPERIPAYIKKQVKKRFPLT